MTRLMFSLQHLLLSHLRLKRIRRINMVWHHTTTWRNAPCPRTHVHVYELRINSLVVGISHKNLSWFSWEYSYVLIPTCCGHAIIMLCASLLTDPKQRTHPFCQLGLSIGIAIAARSHPMVRPLVPTLLLGQLWNLSVHSKSSRKIWIDGQMVRGVGLAWNPF